jgi:PAS domain S-box-containing protein
MHGVYDSRLVALSVLIAIFAAYAALDLASRVTAASRRSHLFWLAGGALAMGCGIWSMHYVGMLAFSLPIPVQYDWPTVLLSLMAAIFASAVALFVVSRTKISWPRLLVGGVVMGCGISTMHYTGMAAMRLAAMCSYDPFLFSLSVFLAIVISLAALWLTFQFRGDVRHSPWLKAASAIVMGSAIPVMHYTGMAAARFTPSPLAPDLSHAVSTSTLGFTSVSVVTLLISAVAVITSAVDRRFSTHRMQLAASERRYQLLVDGAKDCAIFMVDPNGLVASWNVGAERIYGYSAEEIIGRNFSCFFPTTQSRSDYLVKAAKEGKVEDQGWRIRKDGTRFWADSVITSLWENGKLQGFSKVVRDITGRKRAEESLRELSARLLEMRDDERRRIARELHDSAGQIIAAINMSLTPLAQNCSGSAEAVAVIEECLGLLGQLSSEIRTLSHLLHPPLLDEVGLASALRLYVEGFSERSRVRVDLDIPDDFGRLSRELETAVFRIVQESLTNVHRHSGSDIAKIRLWQVRDGERNEVCVEIEDEGKGISGSVGHEPNHARAGVGIRGMQERVHQLGGRAAILTGTAGKGTVVFVSLPLEKSAATAR